VHAHAIHLLEDKRTCKSVDSRGDQLSAVPELRNVNIAVPSEKCQDKNPRKNCNNSVHLTVYNRTFI
jgi:hypothetical protein